MKCCCAQPGQMIQEQCMVNEEGYVPESGSCTYSVLCGRDTTKVHRTSSLDAPCAQHFQGTAAVLACYHRRGSDTVSQPDGAQHTGALQYLEEPFTRIRCKQPGMTRTTCWLQHIHLFVPATHHAVVSLQHRQKQSARPDSIYIWYLNGRTRLAISNLPSLFCGKPATLNLKTDRIRLPKQKLHWMQGNNLS